MQHNFVFSVNLLVNGQFNSTLSLCSIEDSGIVKYVVMYSVDLPIPINRHKVFVRKQSAYKYFNAYLSKLNKSLI